VLPHFYTSFPLTILKDRNGECKSREMVPGDFGEGVVTIGVEGGNKDIELHASEAEDLPNATI
jgi:hypothetical protein